MDESDVYVDVAKQIPFVRVRVKQTDATGRSMSKQVLLREAIHTRKDPSGTSLPTMSPVLSTPGSLGSVQRGGKPKDKDERSPLL